ncbi:MAG: gliding motility-associated C-terminal domain-containing protein, partial [Bacteroidota bacterium]
PDLPERAEIEALISEQADAVDLGGNTGWTITEKATEDFFWIGGTGNWNDPAHWSATSGGPTNGCVPSVTDNVFFDANSFTGPGQTVTINVENAACRNMTWTGATGNPNFSGPEDHRMRIAGSLTFVQAMNHDFAGDYVFSARDAGHVITSARQRFNRNVTFDGSGEWSLGDSLYVFEAIDLEAGTLRTADQPVNANFLRSRNAQPRGLFLGNSYVNLASRDMTFFYTEMVLNSENLTFDAGTSVIEFTGGFSGNTFLSGDIPLTFNVVIFSSPLGQWSHNLFADGMGLAVTVDSLTYRNSGFIGGENLINYLELRAGRTYEFLRNSTQTVAELVADGSCDEGHTTLQSTTAEEPSFLELPGASGYDRLLLRNMHVTDGAPLPAANSIDGGGNQGWDISGDASRQLFWVGGEGDWFDRSHWSLTSGGPGGECLPTAIDDVFFDENSAVGMPMRIQNFSDRSATCRDITWTAGMTTETFFQVGTVRIHGDLNNAGNLFYNSSPTYFNGVEDDHEIISGGANLNQMVFTQTGTYTIADDLTAGEINYQSGNLIFANERSELFRMVAVRGQGTKNLDLGNTHLVLNAGTFGFSEALSLYTRSNLAVTPGTSLIEFTHPTARLRADVLVTLNNLLFSNPTANAEIRSDNPAADALTANSVTFNGSGRLSLELTTDTLVCSPGKSYVFASEKTQRINEYWQIIGNNCTPISLTASTPGLAATASVPASGEILADFIQMRDITGVGGANFLAGSRSTNIDNSNANWVFETAPEFQEVGFLGQDRALCAGEDLTLDAYNFSPGETYRWQDNSTDSTFVTNQSGTYFVEVTFQTSCVIRDTVEILDAQTFTVDLPDDPVICFGDTLTFDVDAGINSADYRWQDGSEESSLQAFTSGEYFVEVDLGGCTETDTTDLTVTPLPTVDLGENRIACVGDDFTLTADVMAETFRWQDGSTEVDFTDDQAGTYWVEARNGNCPVRDSIEVTYVDPGTVDLGPDTTVCITNQLVLDADVTGGFTYTWQDGSAGQTFTAVTTGQYFVEIDLSGCTAADTIEVTFPDLPELDVVPGYEACLGETLEITATVPADAYRWSNQQTGPNFSTMDPGDYLVTAVFGPCEVTQDFTVDFLAPPVVDLGADITECSGVPVTLTIPLSGTWQDGTQGASYLVTEPGRYRVEAFNGPCPATDSVEVSYLPLPEFSLGEDQTGCAGDPLTVSVPTNLGLIFWDDGADATERSFTEAGVRWVEIEDDNGCVGRDSVEFFYNEFPSIGLGPDTTACDDRPFVLTASASGGNLLWPDGSTAPTFAPDPAGGRTTVVAQLTENGCTSLDTVVVDFRECLDFQAYVPTAFSPNFDGVNDDFGLLTDARIEILEYRISVWSRWGAELFSSADPNELWDGTADGRDLPTGVYLYAIELTIRDDRGVRSQSISGDVTLVR